MELCIFEVMLWNNVMELCYGLLQDKHLLQPGCLTMIAINNNYESTNNRMIVVLRK